MVSYHGFFFSQVYGSFLLSSLFTLHDILVASGCIDSVGGDYNNLTYGWKIFGSWWHMLSMFLWINRRDLKNVCIVDQSGGVVGACFVKFAVRYLNFCLWRYVIIFFRGVIYRCCIDCVYHALKLQKLCRLLSVLDRFRRFGEDNTLLTLRVLCFIKWIFNWLLNISNRIHTLLSFISHSG